MKLLFRTTMVFWAGIVFFGLLTGAENGNSPDTKSFTVKKGGILRVNLNGGDIRLIPWEKDQIDVRVRGSGENDEDAIDVKQRDNTIVVQSDEEEEWNGGTRVEISLPSQFDVDVRTAQGDITIDGAITGKISG